MAPARSSSPTAMLWETQLKLEHAYLLERVVKMEDNVRRVDKAIEACRQLEDTTRRLTDDDRMNAMQETIQKARQDCKDLREEIFRRFDAVDGLVVALKQELSNSTAKTEELAQQVNLFQSRSNIIIDARDDVGRKTQLSEKTTNAPLHKEGLRSSTDVRSAEANALKAQDNAPFRTKITAFETILTALDKMSEALEQQRDIHSLPPDLVSAAGIVGWSAEIEDLRLSTADLAGSTQKPLEHTKKLRLIVAKRCAAETQLAVLRQRFGSLCRAWAKLADLPVPGNTSLATTREASYSKQQQLAAVESFQSTIASLGEVIPSALIDQLNGSPEEFRRAVCGVAALWSLTSDSKSQCSGPQPETSIDLGTGDNGISECVARRESNAQKPAQRDPLKAVPNQPARPRRVLRQKYPLPT